MSTPLVLSSLLALAFLGLFWALLRCFRGRVAALSSDAGADRESFSDYYRPMVRLLDDREFASARLLSNLDDQDLSRFKLRRIQVFRRYLDEMQLDFNRIEFKLRYLMLAAGHQEAHLVTQLNGVKSRFQLQLFRVRLQLFLFRFGWVTINAEPLVNMLEQFESVLLKRPATNN